MKEEIFSPGLISYLFIPWLNLFFIYLSIYLFIYLFIYSFIYFDFIQQLVISAIFLDNHISQKPISRRITFY